MFGPFAYLERSLASSRPTGERRSGIEPHGQGDIKTLPGAVAVHRGEQNFAGAERDHFAGISDGVDAGRVAAAMGEDFPTLRLARLRHFLGIDGDHDALIAELFRRLLD